MTTHPLAAAQEAGTWKAVSAALQKRMLAERQPPTAMTAHRAGRAASSGPRSRPGGRARRVASVPHEEPVVENSTAVSGKLAFTVRAKKGAFTHNAGRLANSAGIRRNVVQRRNGTEERAYGNSPGPGTGEYGFEASEWKIRVDQNNGDVTAAVRG